MSFLGRGDFGGRGIFFGSFFFLGEEVFFLEERSFFFWESFFLEGSEKGFLGLGGRVGRVFFLVEFFFF